jgi:hypothetical protein
MNGTGALLGPGVVPVDHSRAPRSFHATGAFLGPGVVPVDPATAIRATGAFLGPGVVPVDPVLAKAPLCANKRDGCVSWTRSRTR